MLEKKEAQTKAAKEAAAAQKAAKPTHQPSKKSIMGSSYIQEDK